MLSWKVQWTLEQHRFDLLGSTSTRIGWGRREALEQQCFFFAPGNLLVELTPLQREKNLCFTPKHASDPLYLHCRSAVGKKGDTFLPKEMADYSNLAEFMSLVDQVVVVGGMDDR